MTLGMVIIAVRSLNVFKVSKYSLLAIALLGNVSCASTEPELPEHFSRWSFGFVQPYLYPTYLSHDMYAVNEKEDWTSLVHVTTHETSWDDINEIYSGNYDGYGIAFADYALSNQLGLGTNHLPDKLYIRWSSYNYARYVTVIDVTPKMKAKMLEPQPHPRQLKFPCYQTEFLFGLLPNGNAKLWLSGCRIYTYVGEFKPELVEASDDPINNNLRRRQLREDRVGAKAEPIPWDKVDKVYYNQRYFKMDRLDDWKPKK